jgi:ankyrin repeat protein
VSICLSISPCFLFVFFFSDSLEELYDACEKGDLEKVKSILSENTSLLNEGLGDDGTTALYTVSFKNHPSIVSYLLEEGGVDVNKANKVNDRFNV